MLVPPVDLLDQMAQLPIRKEVRTIPLVIAIRLSADTIRLLAHAIRLSAGAIRLLTDTPIDCSALSALPLDFYCSAQFQLTLIIVMFGFQNKKVYLCARNLTG